MAGDSSPWAPLSQPLFRGLWIAAIVSNIGTWVQEVGAVWLMTSLSASPLLVALVQSATLLPLLFFAIPAGALADMVDKRRWLMGTQLWMGLMALVMAALTLGGAMTPMGLLGLTFTLGLGTALMWPAWAAAVPDWVERDHLQQAIALNSMGINVARALGPALGGLVVTATGPWAAFLLNALSFLAVLVVLRRWRYERRRAVLPGERFMGALKAGVRYVRHAPDFQAVLVRAASFFFCANALLALLPVIVRREMQADAHVYGLLLTAMGVGAILGALLLPRLRARLSRHRLVAGASLLLAALTLAAAFIRDAAAMGAILFLLGAAWIATLSSLMIAAQTAVPAWVRGRALAVYMTLMAGGLSLGAAIWGAVASRAGVSVALTAAAVLLALGALLTLGFRLKEGDGTELVPSGHWPEPREGVEPDRGPVIVTVAYRIDPARREEFRREMESLRRIRLRDGAFSWQLAEDAEDPGRWEEIFVVESWLEHLRQHERVTLADQAQQERLRAFHLGAEPPAASHWIAG